MKNYHILKGLCKRIFFIGSGNFWYEDEVIGNDNSILYKMLKYILFSIYGFMTLLEIMAALIGEFSEDEKSDSVTFAVSHTIVMIKIYSVLSNKESVKKLIHDLIKVCEIHEEESLMKKKYRIIKINVVAYFITVYGSAACFVFEGVRKTLEGSHFVTVVTYYPQFGDNSLTATVVRIFMTIILFMLLLTMIMTVDGFTVVNLIIFKYKFITLRNYIDKLRINFENELKENKSKIAAKKLTKGLIDGIIMHKELLRLSKEIDKAFGTVMALQLCQSSGSAVSLLLQIALSDKLTLVAEMKICFFVVALFFLLGVFLCNAGEITYQASLVSESIFYCGWHLSPSPQQRHLGKLVLLAGAKAQQPLVMKAFKMLELTYGTFLLVVRATYSVFALFYAQNQ
ncbi:uncharacterized protein LOC123659110 [Melitaea cinxia]|uniref:uncharacterized protein LOC123659110 n=1 Tax=Melitaea cinxia TaxID=113334 RepID=UPI001E2732DE|nr:uncharacterized protein LOC123659110 [Melitaea cinxia]